jgi:hypothetical protein
VVPELRQRFNTRWSPDQYGPFLDQLDKLCHTHVSFRVSETPCFLPRSLVAQMCGYGRELIMQLMNSAEYRRQSHPSVPPEFEVANEDPRPVFLQVDFGLACDSNGNLQPKLVELQAFPSLYAYQPALARLYQRFFDLPSNLDVFLGDFDESSYWSLLRDVIVGDCDPANVILLEIDPFEQKTLPDFLITRERLGIAIVNIRHLVKNGRKLFYEDGQKRVPVQRIYNRCIVDELVRKNVRVPFDLREDLDVKWVGHPNWYFRISKFSIPFLDHPSVPRARFLHEFDSLPADRENWVLKPLYSFAGSGIKFAPTDHDVASISPTERQNYLLQERVRFEPVIETPFGLTQMEVRIMYVWPEDGELTPVLPLVRMGRGKMMGVDHNKDLQWVGGSAGLLHG